MADSSTPGSQISFLITKTLPQLVQLELERLILSGELHGGERLNEVAIAERLNVSRGPVREALRTLEEAGLVRFEKNRGATVRVISPEEAVEIYEIRGALEQLACRRLAARIQPAQLSQLSSWVDEMQSAAEARDVASWGRLNMRFHEALVEFSGNSQLVVLYRRLLSHIALVRLRTLAQEGSLLESNAEHRGLVARLAAGDAHGAADIVRQHIVTSSKRVEHAFRAETEKKEAGAKMPA